MVSGPPHFRVSSFFLLGCLVCGSLAGDPYVFNDWTVSYLTTSPLGDKQQMIGINGQFPGPILNITTDWNIVVNVKNDLDEPLLLTWNSIQQRKNSWQDGVSGTNCPIPAGLNWTYKFQVKDQIGSFFYLPSLNFQRAAGGHGGIIINNRDVIPLLFGMPDGDITIFISDWYTKSHKGLRKDVENGIDLGVPDGILINGLSPYHYDQTHVKDGIVYRKINIELGTQLKVCVQCLPVPDYGFHFYILHEGWSRYSIYWASEDTYQFIGNFLRAGLDVPRNIKRGFTFANH